MKIVKILLLLIFGRLVRKPLEAGKYYKQIGDLCLYRVTGLKVNGNYTAFGIDFKGDWTENTIFGNIKDSKLWYEVSEEIFLKALRQECKRREYSYKNINSLVTPIKESDVDTNIENWTWLSDYNTLYTKSLGNGGVRVFSHGNFLEKKQW